MENISALSRYTYRMESYLAPKTGIPILTQHAFYRYRFWAEWKYFFFLMKLLKDGKYQELEKSFSLKDISVEAILEYEFKGRNDLPATRHDVKAIEYYLREVLLDMGVEKEDLEMVHFGLTSQDINNLGLALQLQAVNKEMIQDLSLLIIQVIDMSYVGYYQQAMISRTHGQPAVPTTMGKELKVFTSRIQRKINILQKHQLSIKFGGAVNNLNAQMAALPKICWSKEYEAFLQDEFGLVREKFATQVGNNDTQAELLDHWRQVCNICIGWCQDMWYYISIKYFNQKIKKGEVGSSTMSHKVNPIDFENAEGNFKKARSDLNWLSDEITISRLQRDLSDSTKWRNVWSALGHVIVGIQSLQEGFRRVELNEKEIARDLEENCVVIMEGIQTVLRLHGYPGGYEKTKEFSRTNAKITLEDISKFIDELEVSDEVKKELHQITPETYIGDSGLYFL